MTSSLKSFKIKYCNPLPFLSTYFLNVSPPSKKTSRIVTDTSRPNRKGFALLKAQLARKYTQCQFTWHTRKFNKKFWQQNLATSKFLVKCILLKALFLSSRKQFESFTLKHHYYHQLLQRRGSTNHHMVGTSPLKHTLPLPSSWNTYPPPIPPPSSPSS